MAGALLAEMDRLYTSLPEGADDIFRDWRGGLVTLGKAVSVTSSEGVVAGVAGDVEADGSLVLRLDDGSLMRVVAGDVTLRHQE